MIQDEKRADSYRYATQPQSEHDNGQAKKDPRKKKKKKKEDLEDLKQELEMVSQNEYPVNFIYYSYAPF